MPSWPEFVQWHTFTGISHVQRQRVDVIDKLSQYYKWIVSEQIAHVGSQ